MLQADSVYQSIPKSSLKYMKELLYNLESHLGILTLSVPEKLKNSIFLIQIISQTLNINNYRTTSARSINLHIIRKLFECFFKNALVKTKFLSPFLRDCCSKVGRYYEPHSGVQGAKGLNFQGKTKKYVFCLICSKSDCLTSLGSFECFYIFFDFA